ncbi:MAG: hypothetical protein LH616_15935, partial [Ilumatobacteraceae bacterium]|nr:hypothetical protein [Ilumatobacteraceae bacterium]
MKTVDPSVTGVLRGRVRRIAGTLTATALLASAHRAVTTGTGPRRGLVAMLAGTLLAGTVIVAPVATGVVQAETWVVAVGGQELSVGNDIPSTGTPGFDANTASPVTPGGLTVNPGDDSTTQNNVVRSGDVTTYLYSVAANEDDGDATSLGVTFEQVFTPNAPLTVNDLTVVPPTFGNCPVARSVQVNVPVGSITVRCTFVLADGNQRSIPIQIQAEGTAPNGTSFTSTQRVFATEGDGDLIDVVYDLSDDSRREEIFITSRPEWQLRKKGFFNADFTNIDPDGAGPEPTQFGYATFFMFEVFSMRKSGNEALQQPITFTDNTRITVAGGLTLAANDEFYITGCGKNPNSFPGTVQGADYSSGVLDAYSVPGQPAGDDCQVARVDGPDANGTVDNNDVYTFTV